MIERFPTSGPDALVIWVRQPSRHDLFHEAKFLGQSFKVYTLIIKCAKNTWSHLHWAKARPVWWYHLPTLVINFVKTAWKLPGNHQGLRLSRTSGVNGTSALSIRRTLWPVPHVLWVHSRYSQRLLVEETHTKGGNEEPLGEEEEVVDCWVRRGRGEEFDMEIGTLGTLRSLWNPVWRG